MRCYNVAGQSSRQGARAMQRFIPTATSIITSISAFVVCVVRYSELQRSQRPLVDVPLILSAIAAVGGMIMATIAFRELRSRK